MNEGNPTLDALTGEAERESERRKDAFSAQIISACVAFRNGEKLPGPRAYISLVADAIGRNIEESSPIYGAGSFHKGELLHQTKRTHSRAFIRSFLADWQRQEESP